VSRTKWALGFCLGSFVALPCQAYCVARACDQTNPELACEYDAADCPITTGRPELFWPSKCISFGVSESASPKLGIDYDDANSTAERAVARWLNADCGGDKPGVALLNMGPIECNQVEYNQTGNANVFLFSDNSWPFGQPGRTIALTIIQFNTETGEIFDADIAVNSAFMRLSTESNGIDGFDLEAVMTHEVGHFLGLAHSEVFSAIMSKEYAAVVGEVELDPDDTAGICAVQPPAPGADDDDCSPRHGFHSACGGRTPTVSGGCALTPAASQQSGWVAFAAAALTVLAFRRPRSAPSLRRHRADARLR
jgi:hypothetical protein